MTDLPDTNNYYSFFENHSVDEIFNVLLKNGWSGHRSSLDDCELSDESSEMELYYCNDGILLNGRLANGLTKYKEIVKLFESRGFRFNSELYDDGKKLLTADNFLKGKSI